MTELFSKLGIEWHLILAQIINFAILLFILGRFAYRPLMKILKERQERIKLDEEKSVELSKEIAVARQRGEEILAAARVEGDKIIKQAEASGKNLAERIIAEAKTEVERQIALGRKTLSDERARLSSEIKKDIGEVVTLAVEKAVGDLTDKHMEAKLVDEALRIINGPKAKDL